MRVRPFALIAASVAISGAVIAAIVGITGAIADDPIALPPAPDASQLQQAVAAGKHVRIDGPRGPVHVWIPAGYHADTGATVVYVHGYYDDADTAWTMHQLPEQFSLSALNALFVVPEAPAGSRMPIAYPDLGELLRLVEDRAGVTRGQALTIALGHSGAFRTVQRWLDEPLIDTIVMIDAMYGEEDVFVSWLGASPRRRLITIGEDTLLATESVAQKIPGTLVVERFPAEYELWPEAARSAKHVYVRAQYGHMQLVTEGRVIPSVLRLVPVERLADQPWKLPLGSLPPLPDASSDSTTD